MTVPSPEIQYMRIALPADLKEKWDGVLEARGISQQRAVVSLVRWLVEQDPLAQLLLFGQVPPDDVAHLSRLVLERLAKKKPRQGAGH